MMDLLLTKNPIINSLHVESTSQCNFTLKV